MCVTITPMSEKIEQPLSVVTIGGGTGSFTLLQEFKDVFSDVTAVVNMADDGGSTGQLRDELGVLPPGDIRQCLVALSEAPQEMRDLFNFRHTDGNFKGHTFGNMFISTVEMMADGDFDTAIRMAGDLLRIKGTVLPVTKDKVKLKLSWPSGETVLGEHTIGNMDFSGQTTPDIHLVPDASLNPAVQAAISKADMVVIAPGNLYGSLAPALIVSGMRESLEQTSATIVYVCNLVTKPGQTDNFRVHDYAAEIERFIGAPVLDYVLYNNEQPSPKVLSKYVRMGELLVQASEEDLASAYYKALGAPLVANDAVEAKAGDAIAHTRSLIRHNAKAVAELLRTISPK